MTSLRTRRLYKLHRPTSSMRELLIGVQCDFRPSRSLTIPWFRGVPPTDSERIQTAWAGAPDFDGVEQSDPTVESWTTSLSFQNRKFSPRVSLRATSRLVRNCLEPRWWNARVQVVKVFESLSMTMFPHFAVQQIKSMCKKSKGCLHG